ncbi:MAG: response regulator [Lentisphaerae bacterium]|nr:MAG: response regulator [Lentisphaerota bacterium]
MSQKKSILIVDDDPVFQTMHRLLLERAGYRVLSAMNGQEGIDTLQREEVDVILLDLVMPVMDGCTFLRTFQGLFTRPIPILIVTGQEWSLDEDLVNNQLIKKILKKPFHPSTLFEAIEALEE